MALKSLLKNLETLCRVDPDQSSCSILKVMCYGRNEIKQSAGVLFVRGRCGTGNKAEV